MTPILSQHSMSRYYLSFAHHIHQFNPVLQRFYSNLQTRALDAHAALQDVDPLITKYLEPDAALFSNEDTAAALTDFEKQFETKVIPKKEMKRNGRKLWNDVADDLEAMVAGIGNGSNGNKKEEEEDQDEEDGDIGLDALIQINQVETIGTKDPIGDFKKLLSQRSSADLFDRLSASLWKVIYSLIDTSYGDLNFKKAVECIAQLKQSCIVEEEAKQFNDELNRFKTKYRENCKLWEMVKSSKLTLICRTDFDDEDICSVSVQDAAQFLADTSQETEKEDVASDSEDDDMDDLV